MIVGIDASNIRAGGGLTHLLELLKATDPIVHGVSQVIIWSGKATLTRIEDRLWITKSHQPLLDKNLCCRTFWQRYRLSTLAREAGCDVLFVPGGSYWGDFRPMVTFSQNLLPFEWSEMRRYGWSLYTIKFLLLRWAQSRSFRDADGVIFLTHYARNAVMRVIKSTNGKMAIIPHGIDKRFACEPREQLPGNRYSFDNPFRILYVSVVYPYKHQWHVAEAVAQLRKKGLPIVLDLVGPADPKALNRLQGTLDRLDPASEFIHYRGAVPYAKLHTRYMQSDMFLFASSCETFGQILTEAMSAGLPIACSNRSAMPELLGDAGVYFDPESPGEIANAIKVLYDDPERRYRLASMAFKNVQKYSWKRCADETFSFISQITDKNKQLTI